MRRENDDLVFAVRPIAEATPQKWREVLKDAGIRNARVSADEGILEVKIRPKGPVTQELIRGYERKIRGNMGQLLQN